MRHLRKVSGLLLSDGHDRSSRVTPMGICKSSDTTRAYTLPSKADLEMDVERLTI